MAANGRRVVVVEQSERMYGGTCPNVGCVPTKALVHRSGRRRPDDAPQAYYEHSVEAVQALTRRDARRQLRRDRGPGLRDRAHRHRDVPRRHTRRGRDGGRSLEVTADTILINTGSRAVVPDIPGLRDSRAPVTSTELIESHELPRPARHHRRRLPRARVRRRSTALRLRRSPCSRPRARILRREDDDVARAADGILRGDGVEIVTGAHVTEVRDDDARRDRRLLRGRRRAHRRGRRRPRRRRPRARDRRTWGSRPPACARPAAGAVEVDEHLRTSQPHIFALGDVNGGPQFTYISLDDSRIVARPAARRRASAPPPTASPSRYTLFMTPPLATGRADRDARPRAAGRRIKVASERVADIIAMPRAYIVEETRGLMKFVIDAETDEILGAALLSVDAQELINTVALAMRHGITASRAARLHLHPPQLHRGVQRGPRHDRARRRTSGRAGRLDGAQDGSAQHVAKRSAVADVELAEHLAQVVLDGARADEQLRADLRVGVPVARQPRDLELLRRQLVPRVRR